MLSRKNRPQVHRHLGFTLKSMTFVGGPFRHQLFWLGVNRAPAGWHKWTFDFDAEAGLEIFHNDHALSAVDSGKTGLRGFSAIAVWGDQGRGHEQTVWLDDLSATLGGPVRLVAASEANPYAERATNPAASRPVIIYTRENAPAAPPLTDLPLLEKVSQYGITWTFVSSSQTLSHYRRSVTTAFHVPTQ